jgi:hypothetical protein
MKKTLTDISQTINETAVSITAKPETKKSTTFREAYPIQEPYVYAAIIKDS